MFKDNKYTKWYFELINNSKKRNIVGYCEIHHIIPRALGGADTAVNLARLTAREHFVCHLLLTKMTQGYEQKLMEFAVGKFIQVSPFQNRKFTSWEYNKIRENISKARTGKKHTEETRKKMSKNMKGRIPWNKGMTGIVHSEESNRKRSNTLKGKSITEEHRKKISLGKTGKSAGMKGKKHSDETRLKMSQSMKGTRGPQKRIESCPTCNKESVTIRHIKFCKITKVNT
jgi:hypothetical protein